jgi:protein-S-isoprenylcysteine O-methyltransferase
MIEPMWLALFYGVSEVFISVRLQSKTQSSATDRGSLRLIWSVITVSMIGASVAAANFPSAYFGGSSVLYWVGVSVFAFGLALRWYSIRYLGKFFTVDVTVVSGQRVIDTGPYRYVRHPAYTGNLLAFFGLGLCFANAVALLLLAVPIAAVFLYRIHIEERALQHGLGAAYRQYMQRTKRLVPFVF